MPLANATTDHGTIRRWAETRKGHPALVKRTEDRRGGVLRIDFDPPEASLDPISWDRFFEVFEDNNLAFLYQEKTAAGRPSRFNKFVSRDTVEAEAGSDDEETGTRRNAKKNAAPAGNGADEADDEDAGFDEDDEDFDDDEDTR